jgi:hypothetical protein
MRRLLLLAVACTPNITSGAYFCGADSLCPEDQTCNGPDNTCVLSVSAKPFACVDGSGDPIGHEPDDTPAQAFALPALTCVSPPFIDNGCLTMGNPANWYKLTSPTGCSSIAITARVEYPTAFEELAVRLADGAGTAIGSSLPCDPVSPGDDSQCFELPLDAATDYTLEVAPTGAGTCDGACNFNRYTLTLTIGPP